MKGPQGTRVPLTWAGPCAVRGLCPAGRHCQHPWPSPQDASRSLAAQRHSQTASVGQRASLGAGPPGVENLVAAAWQRTPDRPHRACRQRPPARGLPPSGKGLQPQPDCRSPSESSVPPPSHPPGGASQGRPRGSQWSSSQLRPPPLLGVWPPAQGAGVVCPAREPGVTCTWGVLSAPLKAQRPGVSRDTLTPTPALSPQTCLAAKVGHRPPPPPRRSLHLPYPALVVDTPAPRTPGQAGPASLSQDSLVGRACAGLSQHTPARISPGDPGILCCWASAPSNRGPTAQL